MAAGLIQFAGSNKGARFEVQKWTQHFLFHNQTNTNVQLTLWECISRYDSPAVAKMSAIDLMQDSLTDAKATGSTKTMTVQTYGYTPYMSNRLTTAFRLKKPTVIELNAGSQATYVFRSRRKKTINMNRYQNTSGTTLINGEAGFYRILLYRIHGYPCNDLTTKTNILISEAAIDYTLREKAIISSAVYQNFPTYAFMQQTAYPASANPTIMSEASGTAQAVTTA